MYTTQNSSETGHDKNRRVSTTLLHMYITRVYRNKSVTDNILNE